MAAPTGRPGPVAQLIQAGLLSVRFQPIANLDSGRIFAHEALARGPENGLLHLPEALFAAAREERIETELELACASAATRGAAPSAEGRLFVNFSARALVAAFARLAPDTLPAWIDGGRIAPSSIVIEMTEHGRVEDHDALLDAVQRLRRLGMGLALDDFGDGRSSLRLWSELRPDFVKIDKYFAQGIAGNGDKLATYRALIQIAEVLGTRIVAEGIENEEDLVVVRDLGIPMAQGWLIGRPQPEMFESLPVKASKAIERRQIAVFPERGRLGDRGETIEKLTIAQEPIGPTLTNDELYRLFRSDESRWAVAIAEAGRPIGLVNRQRFMDLYAKPYYRELYGRKACTLFANLNPLMLDHNTAIDELNAVLTSEDQRYLTEGFIVVHNGLYAGLGMGQQLVRSVTERRIEAARHANPLTLLPGNIPITAHIRRLLDARCEFTACYCDMDSFKPFNDKYGYWRGDEMIQLAARVIVGQCDPRRDFVGHVGGDDFVLLLQSDDWEQRCRRTIEQFAETAPSLYDEEARDRGGIEADDRYGVRRFFPFTTLSIGVVRVEPGTSLSPEGIASAAALAKHRAKSLRCGIYLSVAPHGEDATAPALARAEGLMAAGGR